MVETNRRPVLKLHAECQTVRSQDFLNLIERLASEVRSLEKFVFCSLDQIADVVNVFGFQAVRRTNGEFKIVNRTAKDRINRRLRFDNRLFNSDTAGAAEDGRGSGRLGAKGQYAVQHERFQPYRRREESGRRKHP